MSVRRRRLWIASALVVLAVVAAALALGPAYRDAVQQALSLPQLEAASLRAPRDDRLHVRIALRRLAADEFDRATESLRRAAEAGNRDDAVWRLWAAQVVAVGERADVEAILQRGIAVVPERFRALPPSASGLERAQALLPEGIEALSARYDAPNFLSGWLGRENALAAAERAALAAPDDPERRRRLARALIVERRYAEAIEALEGAGSIEDRQTLGEALEGAGRDAEALVLYRGVLAEKPGDLEATLGAGRAATARRMVFVGMELGQQAVKLAPESAEAWVVLGRAYHVQKLRWDRAAEAFEKARRIDEARLLRDFGPYYETLKALGRFDDAEALLRKRLAQDPDDPTAHYLLASALLDRRADAAAEKTAEESLRTALRLRPGMVAALVRLGQQALGRGDAQEAAMWLTKAQARDRYHPQASALLARALRQAGRTDEAAEAEATARSVSAYLSERTPLEDARGREPTNRSVLRRLADLYRRGGETEKAHSAEQALAALEGGGS